MELTPDKAREIGEALIDAAVDCERTGIAHHVLFSAKFERAISLPTVDRQISGCISHTVVPK